MRSLVRLEARLSGMKRPRRLRRLVPDRELVRRRAAGETLRALARDYEVAHTTLGRYFGRPEVVCQLREACGELRAEQRALAAQRAKERQLEQQVRRRAREQAAEAREDARRIAAMRGRPPRRSAYEAWLDEKDAHRPPSGAERYSHSDESAERAVAAGGGVEAVLEATGLLTREIVLRLIDPGILVRAFANDRRRARVATPPKRSGLRRLEPDLELIQRRAAREPLRRLAKEYGVAHTTLCRYFARPDVARQLRPHAQLLAKLRTDDRETSNDGRDKHALPRPVAEELAAAIREIRCPKHGRAPDVRCLDLANGDARIEASCCCKRAQQLLLHVLNERLERDHRFEVLLPSSTRRRPPTCATP